METIIEVFEGKETLKAKISPLNKRHHSIQPLKDIPKSWIQINLYETSLNNRYNQSLMRVYKTQKDGLRFSMFRDGCFFEYCGRIEFIS